MNKKKRKRSCKNCRYLACNWAYYPCSEGIKHKLAGKECGLWEPRLKIQKLWDTMGNMYVRLKGH